MIFQLLRRFTRYLRARAALREDVDLPDLDEVEREHTQHRGRVRFACSANQLTQAQTDRLLGAFDVRWPDCESEEERADLVQMLCERAARFHRLSQTHRAPAGPEFLRDRGV